MSPILAQLIQDIQSTFKNKDHLGVALLTHLYEQYEADILTAPVRWFKGYGFATGKRATFLERCLRFVDLIKSLRETGKSLYSTNMGDVSTYLFLYDLGRLTMDKKVLIELEKNGDWSQICGQTFLMAQEAAVKTRLGADANMILSSLPIVYGVLGGRQDLQSPEVTMAANIIFLDQTSIESLKFNFKPKDATATI